MLFAVFCFLLLCEGDPYFTFFLARTWEKMAEISACTVRLEMPFDPLLPHTGIQTDEVGYFRAQRLCGFCVLNCGQFGGADYFSAIDYTATDC